MDKNLALDQECAPEEPISCSSGNSVTGTSEHIHDKEVKNVAYPKDAVDEWPAPKKIHTFYFVKYQFYEDLKIKIKLEQIDKEIQRRSKERSQITEALKEKRTERSNVISQLKPLTAEDRRFRVIIDGKKKEMEPLQAALGKLRTANNLERGMICSSEEELDNLIQSLQYRIQHESNTLTEEKQLLKDIKQLERAREKVIAHAAMKAKLQDSLGPREAIQDQVKLIGGDMVGVKKEQQAVRMKIRSLEEVLKAIDEDISSLQEELSVVIHKKDKVYETLHELRKTRDEANAVYYQNRSILNTARELAVKKDVAALEELSYREAEKFMSQWSGNKIFRDDYEKRILPSLDRRRLSRDGRMRNPDEKSLVLEAIAPRELETSSPAVIQKAESDVKPPKVDVGTSMHHLSSKKAPKSDAKKLTGTEIKGKATLEARETLPSEEASMDLAPPAMDSTKLMEMKREEEMAKAKLALDRKKKLADKAAAKAAVRAQKEAVKQQKERGKKAKKKEGATVPKTSDNQGVGMIDGKAEEQGEPEEACVLDHQMHSRVKGTKENARHRTQSKGVEQRPKLSIPQRKKSHSRWLWVTPAGASLLVILFLGYCYYYAGGF